MRQANIKSSSICDSRSSQISAANGSHWEFLACSLPFFVIEPVESNLNRSHYHWLTYANMRQHVKVSAQWIKIWLINSTESFLLGNLRRKGKVKQEAIKEQRQRS